MHRLIFVCRRFLFGAPLPLQGCQLATQRPKRKSSPASTCCLPLDSTNIWTCELRTYLSSVLVISTEIFGISQLLIIIANVSGTLSAACLHAITKEQCYVVYGEVCKRLSLQVLKSFMPRYNVLLHLLCMYTCTCTHTCASRPQKT